ncbi:MAG: radical SAM protein [Bdellovibrionales bacterium GWA2_49_15]|nr:MAG: radical SAM protein [Bdellovibrionales bacterium GWA2_49_15]HAZ14688.1 radical SAM protein [Bdellovibrionales bacterium]
MINELIFPFTQMLGKNNLELTRNPTEILQINVGKLCNQVCHHCHVEAGPNRTEIMTKSVVNRLLELLAGSRSIHTVDLTGGAPELNPHFRTLVRECRKLNKKVINRCNLTVLFEDGQEDTAGFLREHRVHVVASLPCYSKENLEKQRGDGVFDKSIRALRMLNSLGYGLREEAPLLDLVYNPLGAFLPPTQETLENKYKEELRNLFGIEFNHLYTITNMPIKRFLRELERAGKLQKYMELLLANFNPKAALGVMCRSLISVSWDGKIFDCDFNQMLDLPLVGVTKTIWDIKSFAEIEMKPIALGNHCYGCTAGAGSSCSGTVAK